MSYFLWIEDFENSPKVTASDVFGNVIDEQSLSDNAQQLKNNLEGRGIFIELSFQDGLEFIRNKLKQVDYIILDIDLPAYSEGDEMKTDLSLFLKDHYGYDSANDDEALFFEKCKALKEVAGYHIYTELVIELGFPKEHILFCSNHGENLKSIQEAFKTAKISLPTIHQKSDQKVQAWVSEKHGNQYSRLRRGIINGCQYLKKLPADKLRFGEFIKRSEKQFFLEDVQDYLFVLEQFFPLISKDNSSLYKFFIRVLAHEWDIADPQSLKHIGTGRKTQETFAFSSIMKMTRNWSAHGNVFDGLKPHDVAYLFIINMRAMFDLGEIIHPYESYLLYMFKDALLEDDIKSKIGTDHQTRKLPLIENYAALLEKVGNNYQAINFHDLLNDLQKNKITNTEHDFLMRGLYQAFWYLTSYGHVYLPPNKETLKRFSKLNYQFKYFDYSERQYLLEISRHIYNSSFL